MSNNITPEQNLQFLKKQFANLGFGQRMDEKLEWALTKALANGEKEITLDKDVTHHKQPTSIKDDLSTYNQLEIEPYLKRRKDTDIFDFPNFKATLTKPGEQPITQFVSTDYGKAYTVKEIANALDGGSVFKPWVNYKNEQYKGWKKLNFDQKKDNGNFKEHIKHENYSPDLRSELRKQNVHVLDSEHENNILASLQRGNYHEVPEKVDNKLQPRFLRFDMESGQIIKYEVLEGKLQKIASAEDNSQNQSQDKQQQQNNTAATQAAENDKKKQEQQRTGNGRRGQQRERAPEKSVGKGLKA
jgi:hypothetical protein